MRTRGIAHARTRRRIVALLCLLNLALLAPVGAEALAQAWTPPIIETTSPATAVSPGYLLPAPQPHPVEPPPEPAPAPAPPAATTTGDHVGTDDRTPVPEPAPAPPAAPSPPAPSASEPQPTPATITEIVVARAPAPAAAAPAVPASEVRLAITLVTRIRNVGGGPVTSGDITIPLMSVMHGTNQTILSESIVPAPLSVSTDALGNRVATFGLTGLSAGEVLAVRQEYLVQAWGGAGTGDGGPVLPAHLESAVKVESEAPEIVVLAGQLTANLPSVQGQAAALLTYTREALRYDANSPARNQGALAGLVAGSGVCEEYASLFVALCRAVGIPARVVNGWGRDLGTAQAAWPDGTDLRRYRHAWAEVFIPAYGWVTVDPTFNRAGLAGIADKPLPSGTLIADNYGDRSITGRYTGGKIEVTRDHRLNW